MPYHFKSGEPVPEAIRRIALEEIASAAQLLEERGTAQRDHAVHEARKSVKKIRALLRLCEEELGPVFGRENRRFRNLARRLSDLRDRKAVIEAFDGFLQGHGNRISQRVAASIRRALVQSKRSADRQAGARQVARDIAEALRSAAIEVPKWPLRTNGFFAIRAGFKKALLRGEKAQAEARKNPLPENNHEWRKRVKDHVYHVRLLVKLDSHLMRKRAQRLRKLETWLGDLHNLTVLRELILSQPDSFATPDGVKHFLDLAAAYEKKLLKRSLALADSIYDENPEHFTARVAKLWPAAPKI